MTSAVAEVTWLLGLFKDLGINIQVPVTVLSDSKSAIQIAVNPIFHDFTSKLIVILFATRSKLAWSRLFM